ncbi:MAG: metallophosphoesterase family protein [Candidatus Aminicenantes bacterium]|nr:metallophosphoesterase family protein [Candidatus Aminicenantes bacterium]
MRLAVVSDIHGNLPALEAVAADIRRRGVDRVLNLGDNLSGPLLPLETARFLMAEDWLTLAGNHERQILTQGSGRWCASDEYAHSRLTDAEFQWLRSLPALLRPFPDVVACHGTPAHDDRYFLETVERGRIRPASPAEIEDRLGNESAPLLLCGHTHTPRAIRTSRGQLIVNPGSVGLPAYEDEFPEPHVVETGSPDARYAIAEKSNDEWIASLISVPYIFNPMAELAKSRGRLDWERALRTGYMR